MQDTGSRSAFRSEGPSARSAPDTIHVQRLGMERCGERKQNKHMFKAKGMIWNPKSKYTALWTPWLSQGFCLCLSWPKAQKVFAGFEYTEGRNGIWQLGRRKIVRNDVNIQHEDLVRQVQYVVKPSLAYPIELHQELRWMKLYNALHASCIHRLAANLFDSSGLHSSYPANRFWLLLSWCFLLQVFDFLLF